MCSGFLCEFEAELTMFKLSKFCSFLFFDELIKLNLVSYFCVVDFSIGKGDVNKELFKITDKISQNLQEVRGSKKVVMLYKIGLLYFGNLDRDSLAPENENN